MWNADCWLRIGEAICATLRVRSANEMVGTAQTRLCPPYAVSARLHSTNQNEKSPGRKRPMNRRELLKAAAALPLAQAALSNSALAQTPWPARNITMIVPFPAGG